MKSKTNNAGFTLIELLVVIAIIGILAAFLFPVFAKVKQKSLETVCISNARQMGLGLAQYLQDNDDQFMTRHDNDAGDTTSAGVDPNPAHFESWFDWIQPYVKSYEIQKCPAFGGPYPIENDGGSAKRYVKSTYLISDNIVDNLKRPSNSLAAIPSPAETILIAESPSGSTSFAEAGTGFVQANADFLPSAVDYLLCPGYTTDSSGKNPVPNGPGSMHFVETISNVTQIGCGTTGGSPAISAWVTCIAVDGHAKSVLLNNANDGGTTVDANGLVHDPPGGYGGMYFTGPDGELTIFP